MEREVMKKSKQNFILICMYKKIYEPLFKTFPHLHNTVNSVHITVGMIMEWYVSISCTPF
jgi:hypothetical protein